MVRNREYWIEKIEENIARDQRNDQALLLLGWTPIHFGEKEVLKKLPNCVAEIDDLILNLMVEKVDIELQLPDEI